MLARPSVASLLIQMTANGQDLATGTAFAVQRNGLTYLVTNRHNLSGRRSDDNQSMHRSGATPDAITIVHNKAGSVGEWMPVIEPVVNADGAPLWLEHPDFKSAVDVVALPLTNLDDVAIYPHDPWAGQPAVSSGVATSLNIVGFPFGLTGGGALAIWSRGTVATEPDVNFDDKPLFLIDSRTRPGQSGSPVIFYSDNGMVAMADGSSAMFNGPVERLLGVYSGRVNSESDLGMVWKASCIVDIVERGARPTG